MELALRYSTNPPICPLGERRIKHYSSSHQILLVGEGDFSFSAALANAFGSAFNMVATSLDSREKILGYYQSAHNTLQKLQTLGATVLHGVDVTTMDQVRIINERLYHRIVYNFPHAGFWGSEHDKAVIKKHRRLVKMFFKNARTMLSRMGEVHVAHKEKHPYNKWKLEKQAGKCGLSLKESVEFHREDYPGYVNRRGDGRDMGQTFFLGACRTYKFILCPSFFDTLHLLSIKPKLPWGAENARWDDAFPCFPTSVQRDALVMGGSLRASVKRRYEVCEEEEILYRPAIRQRTEGYCYSLPRGNDTLCSRAAAVELNMAYFQARYSAKMSMLNMTPASRPAYSRFPSIATWESATSRNQPTSFPGCMSGFGFGFL